MNCTECDRSLSTADVKYGRKICDECRLLVRLRKVLSTEHLQAAFSTSWGRRLFVRYYEFLNEHGVGVSAVVRHLRKAQKLFSLAEKELVCPDSMTLDWIERTHAKLTPSTPNIRRVLTPFLIAEGILKPADAEKTIDRSIRKMLDGAPSGFQRVLSVYYRERLEVRNRQIKNNARKPLSLITIKTDIEIFTRFVRWIFGKSPDINSWEMLQEEHVLSFLQSLTSKHREIVKKDLMLLFKTAKKRRLITHIPMMDTPSREYPPTQEPLGLEEQTALARLLHKESVENPLACLMSCLCLYHGLSSTEIRNIKVQDVDTDRRQINMSERPPVYLSEQEMLLLQAYLRIRNQMSYMSDKEHLILTGDTTARFRSTPVSKQFVRNKVKDLTGYTPKVLRITSFHSYAQRFGPQFLVEAFGLSLTQSSRYGKFEDYLIEEEIIDQRMRNGQL